MFHFVTTFDIVQLRREELIDATRPRRRSVRDRLRDHRRDRSATSPAATVVGLAPARERDAPGDRHRRAA